MFLWKNVDNYPKIIFYLICFLSGALICCYPNQDYPNKMVLTRRGSQYTVELQWLERLWEYENLFETGVV